ncbi:MAG TPA: ABC transporter substrate-binding protein [Candidatus Binatia bacterium]|nr:ABC transporter substrate-binding protein [Candidatus Binatia bacterium]
MTRKLLVWYFFLQFLPGALPAGAQERITFLYPSAAGSWAMPMIAKEAKYFEEEGLAVELVRVGGSTRIVAALIGGSGQLIHAGEPAVVPAVVQGSDVVLIASISRVNRHHLIGRPEIKDVRDLKGKTVGITTFGSTSDYVLRNILEKHGLDPSKDVSIVQTGGQPEGLAAMVAGKIFAQRMSFPLHLKAIQLGMRELADIPAEENTGSVITTRSYIAQRRSTVIRFMKAFIRGMHRYKTDKEFAKKVFSKFAQLKDEQILEATWREYAGDLQRVPRPTLKGIQQVIDSGVGGKKIDLRAERLVELSILDELERSGFIDSVYR